MLQLFLLSKSNLIINLNILLNVFNFIYSYDSKSLSKCETVIKLLKVFQHMTSFIIKKKFCNKNNHELIKSIPVTIWVVSLNIYNRFNLKLFVQNSAYF